MQTFSSSVSPKGQITIPISIRKLLRVKPKDKVVFHVDKKTVKITPVGSPLDASFGAVPKLKKPLTFKQMTDIAQEEHAQHVAVEGV